MIFGPIEIREAAGVRSLHFGTEWIQGAMRIQRPWALELAYTREMMAALLLRPHPDGGWPRRVLQVGLGAASFTRFLHRHRPQALLDVVEIDERVLDAARLYFKLPADPARIRIHIEDAADFVARVKTRYDLILVDGFDAAAKSGRLDQLPFYADCKNRLSREGLLAANLFFNRLNYRRSREQLDTAFEQRTLALPPIEAGNAIVFAATGAPVRLSFAELRASATELKKSAGLNLLPLIARMEKNGLGEGGRVVL